MTIAALEPLVGDWAVTSSLPGEPGGRASVAWELGGSFLVVRSTMDAGGAPDSVAIIAADGDGFLQHYFDSRGVVRLYRMTFDGRLWTLLREEPDFSPLSFRQRFAGVLSEDGATIAGRWEHDRDGSGWQLDFELTYTRDA